MWFLGRCFIGNIIYRNFHVKLIMLTKNMGGYIWRISWLTGTMFDFLCDSKVTRSCDLLVYAQRSLCQLVSAVVFFIMSVYGESTRNFCTTMQLLYVICIYNMWKVLICCVVGLKSGHDAWQHIYKIICIYIYYGFCRAYKGMGNTLPRHSPKGYPPFPMKSWLVHRDRD